MDELGVKNKMSLFCDSLLMQNQWVCTARVAKLHRQHGSYTAKQHGIGISTESATRSVHSRAARSIHSTAQHGRAQNQKHSTRKLCFKRQCAAAAHSTAAVATNCTQQHTLYCSCVALKMLSLENNKSVNCKLIAFNFCFFL